jgi:exonuclease III
MTSTHLHLVTLNVQGLQNSLKRAIVADWMRNNYFDVLYLQETHEIADKSEWKLEFPNCFIYHAFGSSHSRGVSVIVSCLLGLQSHHVYSVITFTAIQKEDT